MKWIAQICGLGVAFIIVASSPGQALAQAPSLAGAWTIKQDESDDLQEVMGPPESGLRVPKARRDAQRDTRDGGGDGRGGGARVSEQQRRVGRALMQLFQQGGQRLAIAQADSTLTLISGGRSYVYYVDERKVEEVIADGVEVEVKAKWDGDKFKVETKASGNFKVTQEFKLDTDTGRLKVKTKLSNSRLDQNFTIEQGLRPCDLGRL